MNTDGTPGNNDIEKFLEARTTEMARQKLRLALSFLTKEQLVSFVHRWTASLSEEQLKSSIYRMLELDDDQDSLG